MCWWDWSLKSTAYLYRPARLGGSIPLGPLGISRLWLSGPFTIPEIVVYISLIFVVLSIVFTIINYRPISNSPAAMRLRGISSFAKTKTKSQGWLHDGPSSSIPADAVLVLGDPEPEDTNDGSVISAHYRSQHQQTRQQQQQHDASSNAVAAVDNSTSQLGWRQKARMSPTGTTALESKDSLAVGQAGAPLTALSMATLAYWTSQTLVNEKDPWGRGNTRQDRGRTWLVCFIIFHAPFTMVEVVTLVVLLATRGLPKVNENTL